MNWRRLNLIVHRDLGYLCVGLTILFAVSGIAANHRSKWNPAYREEKIEMKINSRRIAELESANRLQDLVTELQIPDTVEEVLKPEGDKITIFLKGGILEADRTTGAVLYRKRINRFLLKEINYLHKSITGKGWTYFSDLFAVALILLSVTGLFIVKGKKGIKGRGAWLTSLGFLIPLIFGLIFL